MIPRRATREFPRSDDMRARSDFEFREKISYGGSNVVYRARHIGDKQDYAVKVIRKLPSLTKRSEDQFAAEVTIHSQLHHPSILKVLAVFEDAAAVYLVTELAEGSLAHALASRGCFNEEETLLIARDLLSALVYLHDKSPPILHRDLKVENILLLHGRAVLADFGWAAVVDRQRETFCGTPGYTPPEVLRAEEQDGRMDVWGIGLICYELLHGCHPFNSFTRKNCDEAILAGSFTLDQRLSIEAQQFLRATLQNVENRPTAVEALQMPFILAGEKTLSILSGTQLEEGIDLLNRIAEKAVRLSKRIKESAPIFLSPKKLKELQAMDRKLEEILQKEERKAEEDDELNCINKRLIESEQKIMKYFVNGM